jgi:anti-sigma-K factor RskA
MSGVDTPMGPRDVRIGGLTCAEAEEMAALCVLDVLTPEEAAPVHAHLAACGEPHTDIQRAAEAAGALGSSVEPVPPPVELRDRLMTALADTPQVPDRVVDDAATTGPGVVVPFERPSRTARPSRVVWIGLAAAAVIALLLGGWNLSLQRQLSDSDQQLAVVRQALLAAADPTSRVATLTGTDAAPGASGIAVVPASGTGYLVLRDLPALPVDQVYQAWYLAGGVPTSAGVMDPSTSGLTVMAGLQPVAGTDTIALTIEPTGGLVQPTGAVVVAGTLPA